MYGRVIIDLTHSLKTLYGQQVGRGHNEVPPLPMALGKRLSQKFSL